MIRILIADDDDAKSDLIQRLCEGLLPDGSVEVRRADHLTDAGIRLEDETYDLLILDVQMPLREGEEPRPDGGLRFLRSMYHTRRGRLPRYIVGVTAHAENLDEYREEFAQHNWHLLRYDAGSDAWQVRLSTMIFHIVDSEHPRSGAWRVDLGIVTAREDVELEAVLALPAEWRVKTVEGDPTIYHEGRFQRDGREMTVVAAAALEMGMPASTAISMKMINEFHPRYLAMTGIAAGVKGEFGDILIADVAFDYGSGKISDGAGARRIFLPDPHPIPLEPILQSKFSFFRRQADVLERIRNKAFGGEVPARLNVRMGPLASGAAVVEDRDVLEQVQLLWRKLVGVEMETYGVFLAARLSKEPRPLAMSVKSICDFADPRKADNYQRYAAYTSASFLFEFSLELLAEPGLPR